MTQKTIDKLIINSPYEEPKEHWLYVREKRSFTRKQGRRKAGYLKAREGSRAHDDPGIFVEIPLVNQIRLRVKAWREAEYPGITSTTRRLLEHWNDPQARQNTRFFFCQLEAIETLIWLTEAPPSEHTGIDIPSDGSDFIRQCAKMATGTGKTVVMAMVIAWQVLNKVANPQNKQFSKNILIIAPGLTVKSRLSVLQPNDKNNYYDEFQILPDNDDMEMLNHGRVIVCNWHTLNWETDKQLAKRKGVDKRGGKSDEVYVREVLEEMAQARNLLVINDEAHHAWRVPPGVNPQGEEAKEATKWIGGLDRIHKARGILKCYDFSATLFTPSGGQSSEEDLFSWIVSDFGLNDAIESGLVKTPRVVVRDDARPDAKTFKSRFYHIYDNEDVKSDLLREALPEDPLPDLVINAYYFLGYDWRETMRAWQKGGATTPPVMITVANTTNTAARVNYAFDHKKIRIDELYAPERTLHIDSKVLKQAEESEDPPADVHSEGRNTKLTQKERAELLRKQVDTIGRKDKEGEQIQNVISVGMLSEGWDAKTVTHIMGLRAFSSQLLCEQVVGRGLRRKTYDVDADTGLLNAEYVNIFGVPFTFLPHQSSSDQVPKPEEHKTEIHPISEHAKFAIAWPNVIRIEHSYKPELSLNWEGVRPIQLDASETAELAELAPTLDGKPDFSDLTDIDLENLAKEFRMQKIIFEVALDIYKQMKPNWSGRREELLAQVVHIVEEFIESEDKIRITPPLFYQDELKRRLIITLNMTTIVREILSNIHADNAETVELVLDQRKPTRSTGDMRPWDTSRPCGRATHSHINFCVYDGSWEACEAFQLDRNENVSAWVKNDHLGFVIFYVHRGKVRRYFPDFLVRLTSGKMLILEVKGQPNSESNTKHRYLQEWVKAVNADGRFGQWDCAISKHPGEIKDILIKHSQK